MLCAKTRSAKVNIFMTLCTTLSFSYTIVGTHQGEPDPKRWPLSIVSVPTTHIIGFFIIWATNIYDDGKYLSGDGSICNSEARQCGLYYHTKNHTLAFLGRSLTLLGVLVSKRPRVPGRLCVGLVIFFFFFFSFFLSFFLSFYIINKRGRYGDEGIQPKTSAKTGAESEG
jgi:hypothetical protein